MSTRNDAAPIDPARSAGNATEGSGERPREARPRSRTLLVIEDDPTFARIVGEIGSRRGWKPIVALRGDVGLAMARQLRPEAIVLDVRLPGLDGWSLLDRFKHDASTRHIPVILVSGEDRRARAMRRGAFEYLLKPVSAEQIEATLERADALVGRGSRALLVIDGDDARRKEVVDLVGGGFVRAAEVASGAEAFAAASEGAFDCIVVGPTLADMAGKDLIEQLARDARLRHTPVIYRAQPGAALGLSSGDAVVREVSSPDVLLDTIALFLHWSDEDLASEKRRSLEKLRRVDPTLFGKRVLVVDDDNRNIFALRALLEAQKMVVFAALGGREGLDVLSREFPVDVVLMDVMMPGMDGYETIRAIRGVGAWQGLPVFALTAKAMKGDRDRCMEAGASDYIPKPVDTEQLLSLLRVWLGP
jgi:CheY-like chemotaxis protein